MPAIDRSGLIAWGRHHPVLDGAVLGPLVGLVLLVWRWIGWLLTPYPTILLAAIAATGMGALMGLRRGRRLRLAADPAPR